MQSTNIFYNHFFHLLLHVFTSFLHASCFSPAPPSITLTLTAQDANSISVAWSAPDRNVSWTYSLKYKVAGSSNTLTDVLNGATALSHQLTGLLPGVQYEVQLYVTSYGKNGAAAILSAYTSKTMMFV